MKNITKKQKMIFIILAVIIIAGIAVISTIGFNLELKMQETKKIELYIQKDFEISDIKNIVKEVIPDESIMIQKVEVFEDSVSITAKDITDEQKQSIIDKVNEKYGTELKADSTEIINIPNMKIRDLVKPYVTSFAISTVLILVYIAIRYRKLGSIKTMINSLLIIVVGQVVLFSLIAITRIPVGRLTIPMVLIVYVCTLLGITNCLEKKLKLKKEEKERNKN